MADKDVDEQFAAIMAHWHEDARGLDPFGDPTDVADRTGPADAAVAARDDEVAEHLDDLDDLEDLDGLDGLDDLDDLDGLDRIDEPARLPDPDAPVGPDLREPGPPSVAAGPARPAAPWPDDDRPPTPGLGWREHVPVDEDDHFVPPPPAPLPSADDKHFWLMMAGLVGGPLLFLYLILFNRDGNGWWMVFGLAATVAGFVLLVLRQPFERDEDDDGVRL